MQTHTDKPTSTQTRKHNTRTHRNTHRDTPQFSTTPLRPMAAVSHNSPSTPSSSFSANDDKNKDLYVYIYADKS